MPEDTVQVRPFGGKGFSETDLMEMKPVLLRALLSERTHHNIEVPFYQLVLSKEHSPKPSFGKEAQRVFDVWRERGLPEDAPDIEWVKGYLHLAERIRAGKPIEWDVPLPQAFSADEMRVVEKLIFGRRSIRNWTDRPIPDELIERILEAGRAAPIGCNLGEVRFIVLKKQEDTRKLWSDIPTANAVVIVICYDKRIPAVVSQDQFVPQNAGFDAAAAADHMLLMAHALGLGGVWLSKTTETSLTKDTGEEFKRQFGLPEHVVVALHIAVGWPAVGTVKTVRIPLAEMIIDAEATTQTL